MARGLLREATARRSEARETRMVGRLVDANHLRVLRVSGAESSPAYLGARTWEVDTVAQILIHVALSHGYSTPCSRAGDLAPTAR